MSFKVADALADRIAAEGYSVRGLIAIANTPDCWVVSVRGGVKVRHPDDWTDRLRRQAERKKG